MCVVSNYALARPWFTFLWDTTFPLGFAKEYFLPIVIGFFVSTAETIGDVTNTCFYSRLNDEYRNAKELMRLLNEEGTYTAAVQQGLHASLLACWSAEAERVDADPDGKGVSRLLRWWRRGWPASDLHATETVILRAQRRSRHRRCLRAWRRYPAEITLEYAHAACVIPVHTEVHCAGARSSASRSRTAIRQFRKSLVNIRAA